MALVQELVHAPPENDPNQQNDKPVQKLNQKQEN